MRKLVSEVHPQVQACDIRGRFMNHCTCIYANVILLIFITDSAYTYYKSLCREDTLLIKEESHRNGNVVEGDVNGL